MNRRLPTSSQWDEPFPQDEPFQQAPRRPHRVPWWRQPLQWWYFLTAPPEASAKASLDEREASRRGRLASVVLFFVILLVLPALPTAVGNPLLLVILAIVLLIDACSLILNRSGKTTFAGILVVVGIELGLASSILFLPGGIGISNLPMFDLMVQAECVAVSLIVPRSVFLVALTNSLFFVVVLNFSPLVRPELAALLKVDGSRIISSPIILQVIVAIVTYLWVSSANKAIRRADRAEEIALLEQREIERQQHEIEQKQQLDQGVQQLLQTHIQVANGNFAARAPLGRDNVLWQVAYSLNNLLARLQGYHQLQSQMQRNQEAILYLQQAIQQAKRDGTPLQVERTGTPIDALILELSNPHSNSGNEHVPRAPSTAHIPRHRSIPG